MTLKDSTDDDTSLNMMIETRIRILVGKMVIKTDREILVQTMVIKATKIRVRIQN